MNKQINYKISEIAKQFLDIFILNDGNNQLSRIERERHIRFHIDAGDYFSNLATILDILAQSDIVTPRKRKEVLVRIKDDLLFVQKHYKIIEK